MSLPKKSESIEELIEGHGNNFHYKMVAALRKNDWDVAVSPYYFDEFSDKPREIDISANKLFPVMDILHKLVGYIKVTFLIECKYITQDTAFWFDSKNMTLATKKIIAETPLKDPNHNINILHHHYHKVQEVAILAASDKKETENALVSKALNQCLNAFKYFTDTPQENTSDLLIFKELNYPVIVFNSFEHCYKVHAPPKKITENFQYEMNYVKRDRDGKSSSQYFLIDIIDFSLLDNFLRDIQDDVNAVKKMIDTKNPPQKSSSSI